MSDPGATHSPRLIDQIGWRSFCALTAVLLGLGVQSTHPGPIVGLSIAAGALLTALLLRLWGGALGPFLVTLPIVAGLGALSVSVPVSLLGEVLVALGILALLFGYAEVPGATRGSMKRAAQLLLLPTLGIAVAVAGQFAVPSGPLQLGYASLVLVAILLLVAAVLAQAFFAREAPPASL